MNRIARPYPQRPPMSMLSTRNYTACAHKTIPPHGTGRNPQSGYCPKVVPGTLYKPAIPLPQTTSTKCRVLSTNHTIIKRDTSNNRRYDRLSVRTRKYITAQASTQQDLWKYRDYFAIGTEELEEVQCVKSVPPPARSEL